MGSSAPRYALPRPGVAVTPLVVDAAGVPRGLLRCAKSESNRHSGRRRVHNCYTFPNR
jgi:hypothetical protein